MPSFLIKCGTYDLVRDHGVDSQQRLYFRGGQLVARVFWAVHLGTTCGVGPTSFVEPACDDAPQTPLTDCETAP